MIKSKSGRSFSARMKRQYSLSRQEKPQVANRQPTAALMCGKLRTWRQPFFLRVKGLSKTVRAGFHRSTVRLSIAMEQSTWFCSWPSITPNTMELRQKLASCASIWTRTMRSRLSRTKRSFSRATILYSLLPTTHQRHSPTPWHTISLMARATWSSIIGTTQIQPRNSGQWLALARIPTLVCSHRT